VLPPTWPGTLTRPRERCRAPAPGRAGGPVGLVCRNRTCGFGASVRPATVGSLTGPMKKSIQDVPSRSFRWSTTPREGAGHSPVAADW